MNRNYSRTTNGRINILTSNPSNSLDQFQMYDKIPVNQCSTFRNPTEGLWNNTSLSDTFFSHKNICYVQNAIREGVYHLSKKQFIISNQDEDTLKIIMRSIYLQHAANQPTHIEKQIQELNQIVLDYCIPQVYNEARGYNKYLVDVSTMYTPIPPPILAKQNDKELILHNWV